MRGVGAQRSCQRDPLDAPVAGGEQLVGPVRDPPGDVGVGRAAVGRVVLEAAVAGRVVRRRDDDAVGQARPVRPALWRRMACETPGVGV